jgi:regulator of RNase E activity RraA
MTMAQLSERLGCCYTGVVHDVMGAMGLRDFTLPPSLGPLIPEKSVAGPAFTIRGRTDPRADPHETLLQWTGLLSRAPAGSVWVCQPNDRTVAHMGELSAETLLRKGVRGAVIDGMIRDAGFLLALGFRRFHNGFKPRRHRRLVAA